MPTVPANLTRWTMWSGQESHLMRLHRYPCLIHGIWKLGFVRVARRCITFVERSINWTQPVQIGGLPWKISYHANWNGFEDGANLTCKITGVFDRRSIEFPAWFHLDDLDLRAPMVGPNPESDRWAGEAMTWYDRHRAEVKDCLLQHLLVPFKYEHNLAGRNANSFFGGVGTAFILQAVQIEGCPILVAHALPG